LNNIEGFTLEQSLSLVEYLQVHVIRNNQ